MMLVPARSTTSRDEWNTFPAEIAGLLATNDMTIGAVPLLAIPGHEVLLAGGVRASRMDLWVLARTPRGLISIAIEQPGDDSPRPERTRDVDVEKAASRERRDALWSLLEIDRDVDPAIPRRLIHRTASALLEARRFFAHGAAVIVHSAGMAHDSFGDFQRFVTMMGGRLRRPGHLLSVPPREGIELAFGWAQA
jgi:Domain of unknown function (DUF6946)